MQAIKNFENKSKQALNFFLTEFKGNVIKKKLYESYLNLSG